MKVWDRLKIRGASYRGIIYLVISLVSIVYFSGVPQFNLNRMRCSNDVMEGVKVCSFSRKVGIGDGGNFHFTGNKPFSLLIESNKELNYAVIDFNKDRELKVRVAYFDNVVSPYSTEDKRSFRLSYSYKAKRRFYYLISVYPLSEDRKCSYGFHLSFI